MGERRAEQVAADPFEAFAVAAVAECRCMPSADTVSGSGAAGSGGGTSCGPASASCTQVRSAGVHVLVVVLVDGGEGLVDMREHSRYALLVGGVHARCEPPRSRLSGAENTCMIIAATRNQFVSCRGRAGARERRLSPWVWIQFEPAYMYNPPAASSHWRIRISSLQPPGVT